MEPNWIFDPTPASGARSGGDVAEHAFTPSIDALVRETLQNASDQRLDAGAAVSVSFRIVTLGQRALDALSRGELLSHMQGAADARGGRYPRAVEALESGRMRALIIEDRHTTGLNGPEIGDGNFGALCRDKLFSNKSDHRAGGSYGLGKAVLWRFSQASTVVFASWLSEPIGGQVSPRFIARCTLPWHKTADGAEWSGGGWLGRGVQVGNGARAESLWGDDANAVIEALPVSQPDPGVTGTSIVVVGFEDPTDELEDDDSLAQAIFIAAQESFWPAMADGRLGVRVFVDREEIRASAKHTHDLERARVGRELLRAYRDHRDVPKLEKPGDIAVIAVETEVPPRRHGSTPRTRCRVDLVIRLVDEKASCQGEATMFRGPGMRIERFKPPSLPLSSRPWQAIVVAGNARRSSDSADSVLEHFLREAEPPAHDRWTVTSRLRETYKAGYKKALDTLRAALRSAIQRAVAAELAEGEAGPNALAKLFPVPGESAGGRGPSAFHFPRLDAHVRGSAWSAIGTVQPNVPIRTAWTVRVSIHLKEDGGRGARLPVTSGSSTAGTCAVDRGTLVVSAPSGVSELDFALTTVDAIDGGKVNESTIELIVSGHAQ